MYLVLGVIVVLIAPVVEETMFRGLMLRTLMRRWGFWPAALASSAIFALFHTYEVARWPARHPRRQSCSPSA